MREGRGKCRKKRGGEREGESGHMEAVHAHLEPRAQTGAVGWQHQSPTSSQSIMGLF